MNKNKMFLFVLIPLGITAILCGLYGWTIVLTTHKYEEYTANLFIEVVTRTLLYFVGEGFKDTYDLCHITNDICHITDFNNTVIFLIKASELLALFCSFGMVLWFIIELSHKHIIRWKISRLKNHLVVVGLSDAAKSLIISERKKSTIKIVVIDNEYSLANEEFSTLRTNVFYTWGELSDKKVLTLASITKAESIIVATEQDSCNLRIVSYIRSLMNEAKTRNEPVKTYIKIDCNVFWSEISQSELFKRIEKGVEVIPFNLSVIAARHFIWHYPLYSYADLQNQSRIHSIFIGFNAYADSLLEKILCSCVYKNFNTPFFTLLVSNGSYVEKYLKNKYPGIDLESFVKVTPYNIESDILNTALIKTIKKITPITAIFIFSENNDLAFCNTINVRNEICRCTLSSPPIFIQMLHVKGMQNLIAMSSANVKKFEDIVIPYGVFDEICRLDAIEGALEKIACKLHAGYENTRNQQIMPDKVASKMESLKDWSMLNETYRESNRRAIDHIPAKLATAGCFKLEGFNLNIPTSFQLTTSPKQIEILSELEHNSWSLGRYINGWCAGIERDNRRKIHNLLGKKYTELDEKTKEYDREQLKVINSEILDRSKENIVTVWHDHWVGLIGHNHITIDETHYIKSIFVSEIINKLHKNHEEAFITLVTPLAFGSDLLLTELALGYLSQHKIPHRLLIIEAVPFDLVLKDYVSTHTIDESQIDKLMESRINILSHVYTDWIISLIDEEKDYKQQSICEQGYEEAAEYINTRCHTLIAVHRKGSSNLKGGTTATLLNRPIAIQSNDLFWNMNFPSKTIEIDPQSKKIKIT